MRINTAGVSRSDARAHGRSSAFRSNPIASVTKRFTRQAPDLPSGEPVEAGDEGEKTT